MTTWLQSSSHHWRLKWSHLWKPHSPPLTHKHLVTWPCGPAAYLSLAVPGPHEGAPPPRHKRGEASPQPSLHLLLTLEVRNFKWHGCAGWARPAKERVFPLPPLLFLDASLMRSSVGVRGSLNTEIEKVHKWKHEGCICWFLQCGGFSRAEAGGSRWCLPAALRSEPDLHNHFSSHVIVFESKRFNLC